VNATSTVDPSLIDCQAFFRELGRRPLLPVGDPDIQEVLGHG
jgi:hypothetical protein